MSPRSRPGCACAHQGPASVDHSPRLLSTAEVGPVPTVPSGQEVVGPARHHLCDRARKCALGEDDPVAMGDGGQQTGVAVCQCARRRLHGPSAECLERGASAARRSWARMDQRGDPSHARADGGPPEAPASASESQRSLPGPRVGARKRTRQRQSDARLALQFVSRAPRGRHPNPTSLLAIPILFRSVNRMLAGVQRCPDAGLVRLARDPIMPCPHRRPRPSTTFAGSCQSTCTSPTTVWRLPSTSR